MGIQVGPNNGVTSIINIDGLSPIQAYVGGFAAALLPRLIDITGPGSAFAEKWYAANVGGSLTADAEVQSVQRPFPPVMRNMVGNIVHQAYTNCTLTMPVMIESLTCSRIVDKQDKWSVKITAKKNGQESVNWNGNIISYTPPVFTNTELFADTSKVSDPHDLQTKYTVKYFIPIPAVSGDSSTDLAGNAAVDACIAGFSPPRTGLKVVNATLLRVDDAAGLLIVLWGRTTSVDDLVNPKTTSHVDVSGVETEQTEAAVGTTASPPSAPSAPSGLKLRYTDPVKLDDVYTLYVWTYAVNTVEDDLEQAHSGITVDPHVIASTQAFAKLWDTTGSAPSAPSAPTGLKALPYQDINIKGKYSLRVWPFGTNDSKDEIERSLRHGTVITIDNNGIDSTARIAVVASNGSIPSTPSGNPAGTKYIGVTYHIITDALNLWLFNFGTMDSIDRLQLTTSYTDASTIPTASMAQVPTVGTATITPPSTLGSLVLSGYVGKQIDLVKVVTEAKFEMRNPQQALEMDHSELILSPYNAQARDGTAKLIVVNAGDSNQVAAQVAYATGHGSGANTNIAPSGSTYGGNTYEGTTSPTQGYPFAMLRFRRLHATAASITPIYQAQTYYPPQNSGTKSRIKGTFGVVKGRGYLYYTGTAPGTPTVRVVSCLTRASGKFAVQLGMTDVVGVGGPFSITQEFVGTTPPLGLTSIGNLNSATFFGYPAGSVMFLCADYDILISATSSTYLMTYDFDLFLAAAGTYSNGQFGVLVGVPSGGLIHTIASITPGDYPADSFSGGVGTWTNLPNLKAIVPAGDSFSFGTWGQ